MKVLDGVTFASFVLLSIHVQSSSASCEGSLKAEPGTPQVLTSPNYPANYNSSTTCKWLIKSRYSTLKVQLKIVTFDTTGTSGACTNETDNLEVRAIDRSSDKLLGRYCGNNVGNLTISSTFHSQRDKYSLYLQFTSPSNKTKQGFKLEYMAVQDSNCGPFLLDAEVNKPKVLTSPNYPANFPPDARCSWLITATPGQFVRLNFTNFDLDGPDKYFGRCNIENHTLKVTDSNISFVTDLFLLGKYCGNIVPANVISSKKYLTLVFASTGRNNTATKQGFRLEYSALPSPASYYSMCTRWNSMVDPGTERLELKATSSYQYIQSPFYPNKYPSNLYCTWDITASSSSKRIKAEVTDLKIGNKVAFSCTTLPHLHDALEIRGGYNSAKYCDLNRKDVGQSKTVTSSGQRMTVVFRSNEDNFFRGDTAGFQIRFKEIEGIASVLKISIGVIILAQFLVQLI